MGAMKSRSMKPISKSSASAMPPETPASIVDCIIAPASSKSRKPWTSGKPGSSVARPAPPVVAASISDGKITSGARNCGRRRAWRRPRLASRRATRMLCIRALEGLPCRCEEHVVQRRFDQVQRLDKQAGLVQCSDDRGYVSSAVLQGDGDAAVFRMHALAELADDLACLLGLAF